MDEDSTKKLLKERKLKKKKFLKKKKNCTMMVEEYKPVLHQRISYTCRLSSDLF